MEVPMEAQGNMPAPKLQAAESHAAVKDLIYLCACAVNEETPDVASLTSTPDEILDVAASHSLRAAAAMALQTAGVEDGRATHAIDTAFRNAALFQYEMGEVEGRLQAEGIWYAPLKGAVIKDYYPQFWMREMADHDILVDAARASDVRDIMEGLGFSTESVGETNHDVYHKPPVLNFEIHTGLFDSGSQFHDYYRDVKGRLIVQDGCRHRFSDEDLYLYLVAHEHKHYSGGGTGLRSLLDVYVFLRKVRLDLVYVGTEARKLGIEEFERRNRELAMGLFSGWELGEDERSMLGYVLESGTYGTREQATRNFVGSSRSKAHHVLSRLRVPVSRRSPGYEAFARQYPLFYRHKALLPALPLYRLWRSVADGHFADEFRAMRDVL